MPELKPLFKELHPLLFNIFKHCPRKRVMYGIHYVNKERAQYIHEINSPSIEGHLQTIESCFAFSIKTNSIVDDAEIVTMSGIVETLMEHNGTMLKSPEEYLNYKEQMTAATYITLDNYHFALYLPDITLLVAGATHKPIRRRVFRRGWARSLHSYNSKLSLAINTPSLHTLYIAPKTRKETNHERREHPV